MHERGSQGSSASSALVGGSNPFAVVVVVVLGGAVVVVVVAPLDGFDFLGVVVVVVAAGGGVTVPPAPGTEEPVPTAVRVAVGVETPLSGDELLAATAFTGAATTET